MKGIFNNKKVVISIVAALLITGGIGGYFIYDNHRKSEIMNKMELTFIDVKEVEYGTKDFDVKKELVKEVKEAKLTKTPKLDTSKIGEVTLKFNLKKSDITKEVEYKIKVVDTKAPEISLETESKELTVGDVYDIKSNIKSVTDIVDGDITLNEKASEVNKKATEEYSKLKKEDITDETKVVDKSLNEFFVEITKNEESGKETTQLYLKNCYYIDGSVDVATTGEYTVSVVAVDKHGLKSTKEFVVNVKEKPVEKPVVNNGGGSVSSSSGGGYASNGNSGSSSGGGNVQRGSKQDIINTALAQLGKPYELNASGPNSFDCGGLIWYAYTQNGWNIPRLVSSGGTRIPADQRQPGDIMYVSKGTTGLPHVWLYIGGEYGETFINAADGGVRYYEAIHGVGSKSIFIRY